ncbi:TonB-dependent receptor [Croceicoccus mobilis]|uniref:Ligand-gated channel n=1 Tax=Croceicoccus mobilis TaxID=1703339 RepID=A0A916Z3N0_9SPHN|nr:TonB-dependent siderophore receptor [Croceicoccus mobilis]GGD74553.1 ligand-gated channel [Croceicoccus mobilis]
MSVRRLSAGSLHASLAVALAASAAPAFAEEQDQDKRRSYLPDEILVAGERGSYAIDDGSSATKTPTPVIDVPQAMSVITRDQIEDQNVRQLNDALRFVAGVSLESGEGHRDEVFIRGQESTADFYLNGLRDDAQYYRSLYNVERVEILKGSNALIFGRGGGGGVINRVSKTASPDTAFTSAAGSVDSFGAFAISGDINQPLSLSSAARLNATYEEFASHRDAYEGRFIGVNPTVTLDPSDRTRVVLSYSYDDDERVTDRGVPSLNGAPLKGYDKAFFGQPGFNEAKSQVHIARARVDHQLSESLSVNVSGQFADYDKVYANIVPTGTDGDTLSLAGYRDATTRRNWIGQGNLVWEGNTGGIGHTFLAGFEAISQDTGNSRDIVHFGSIDGPTSVQVALSDDITVPEFVLDPLARNRASELTVLSAYVQDQIEIGEHLQLIGGVRFESFDLKTVDLVSGTPASRKDEKWSPRFGVVVKPQQTLSLYASYSESFLPQAGDQFVLISPTSAELAPEKFENIEAGIKWAPRPHLLVTAAVFQLERSNRQTTDPDNPGFVVLTGKTRTRGFEAQLTGELAPGWNANIGYTYLDGKVRSRVGSTEPGTVLEQVPDHHIAAWTRYDITRRIGIGGGIVHASKQYASLSNAVVLPSYTRVDLAGYFKVNEKVSLQLNIENIFDEDYYPSAHGDNNIQPAKPLNASVSARVSF